MELVKMDLLIVLLPLALYFLLAICIAHFSKKEMVLAIAEWLLALLAGFWALNLWGGEFYITHCYDWTPANVRVAGTGVHLAILYFLVGGFSRAIAVRVFILIASALCCLVALRLLSISDSLPLTFLPLMAGALVGIIQLKSWIFNSPSNSSANRGGMNKTEFPKLLTDHQRNQR